MNERELKFIIEQAVAKLFEHQPSIFDFMPETGQTEWNLAHHFAFELRQFFPALDCDLDVVKRGYDNRRPDIIFHKRGTHEANHLVIEIKRDGSASDIGADIEKIHLYWFRAPLLYDFGAAVNLRSDGGHEVQVFANAGKF